MLTVKTEKCAAEKFEVFNFKIFINFFKGLKKCLESRKLTVGGVDANSNLEFEKQGEQIIDEGCQLIGIFSKKGQYMMEKRFDGSLEPHLVFW